MAQRRQLHSLVAVLMVVVIVGTSFGSIAVLALPVRAAAGVSSNNILRDDFTHDASLNSSLWLINGPVGSVLGPQDAGVNQVPLTPTFSSAGMTIAQVNDRQEYGTIESTAEFTPPFTATAVVEGIVSNGHTFGFAISTRNASSGVLIIGNLNPANCSNLGNCADPNVCGNSATASIPPNQCYYGLDAKVGQGTHWPKVARLYATPSVNVTYTLQISVDASGNARFSASQSGQILGQGAAQVGNGPFFIIMAQVEGSPVESARPNQAIWSSVALTPTASILTTTTTVGPSLTPAGIPIVVWAIIVVVVLLLVLLLMYFRRGGFTVTAIDTRTRSTIPEATVSAAGPKKLTEVTDKDGKAGFGRVKEGDYSVQAVAKGYSPSIPATIHVKGKTGYTVLLDRIASGTQDRERPGEPPGPGSFSAPTQNIQTPGPPGQVPYAWQLPPPGEVVQREPVTTPIEHVGRDEDDGWAGGRLGQIIKTFQEKGAISPETALTADELGLSRLFVRIMKRRKGKTKVFIEINGRFYLKQDALKERD